MFIKKLILENFEAISLAMDTSRIEIDFSTMENKICLFIGPNGSGKTTILSLMTPFATIGNLDVRDSGNLISDGLHGYKEIVILHHNDEYVIKHFYSPNKGKSHTVKSYIYKNGIDLNPNGNVTSFKEIVSTELRVELEYLKLIRLGDNVTSLIKLSETERKTFMSKLLEEIGVFLTFYKKVSSDHKQLNELIKITQSKMDRLGIVSEDDELASVALFEEKLRSIQKESEEAIEARGIAQHNISLIDDTDTLKSRLKTLEKKATKMDAIIGAKESLKSTDPEFYKQKITDTEREIAITETMISSYEITLKGYIQTRDNAELEKRDLQVTLNQELQNDKELCKMEEEVSRLESQIESADKILSGIPLAIDEKELSSFMVFLKNIDQTASTTYGFGKRPIRMIVDLLREGKSVQTFLQSHAFSGYDEDAVTIVYSRIAQMLPDLEVYNEKSQNESCRGCQLQSLYMTLYNMVHVDRDESTKLTSEEIKYMELAWVNIQRILVSFGSYKDIILKLPDDYQGLFATSVILDHIYNLESVYDEKAFLDLLSLVKEKENQKDAVESLQKLNADIDRFSSFSQLPLVRKKLKTVDDTLQSAIKNWTDTKNEIETCTEHRNDLQRTLESLYEYYETFTSYQEIKDDINKLSDELESFTRNSEIERTATLKIQSCKLEIANYQNRIQESKTKIQMYQKYKKELSHYKKIYDEMLIVKRALSSKEGISLRYMIRYIGNTEEVTNELLDIAYGGKIRIDKFDISKDAFAIPFFNKGKRIADVKYASQGQLSFLSVALAFALSSQTLKDYNIMLLDEIDGPLDTSNREKFIQILENQIERIHAEQCFLITHNEMFSSYPVDILDLSFGKYSTDKYPNAHIIEIHRD